VECKQKMAENLVTALAPIREKRAYYEARPQEVEEIMAAGSDKASQTARQTMGEVREAVKV
jgi:tryptophanyl-tRNA synthetase